MELSKMKLIPYKVHKVEKTSNEVPRGVEMVKAPQLWEEWNHGEGRVIAVIDTGVDGTHPNLETRIIDGMNFTTEGPAADFMDENGHGTHVAGTALASLDGSGVVGVAPSSKVLAIKALEKDGSGFVEWITRSVEYAHEWEGPNGEKVDVICMSLGGPIDDWSLRNEIKRALKKDILVVCAAGNSGDGDYKTDEFSFPAAWPEVVSVGAVDFIKRPAPFSNSNEFVDLVAPGVDIRSTYLNHEYARLSGTSMAAPHVAGAGALLLNKYKELFGHDLTEPELYAQLCKYTETLPRIHRHLQGNGLLDLLAVSDPEPEECETDKEFDDDELMDGPTEDEKDHIVEEPVDETENPVDEPNEYPEENDATPSEGDTETDEEVCVPVQKTLSLEVDNVDEYDVSVEGKTLKIKWREK